MMKRLSLILAIACLGSAHAAKLKYDFLEGLTTEQRERLIVCPSIRVAQRFEKTDSDVSETDNDGVFTRSIQRRVKTVLLPRRAKGKIISKAGRSLWISFDTSCIERDCAYRFFALENGKYDLHDFPTQPGYSLKGHPRLGFFGRFGIESKNYRVYLRFNKRKFIKTIRERSVSQGH